MFLKFCEDQLLSANLNNAKNVLKEADHNSMTAELTHGSRELAGFFLPVRQFWKVNGWKICEMKLQRRSSGLAGRVEA